MIQCLGCLDRIQEYASVPGLYDDENFHKETITEKYDNSVILQAISKAVTEERELVKFSNYSAGWKQDALPVLREIQLNILYRAITMIVGSIGSGKSTLLKSILGETLSMGGAVGRNLSLAVYCSQTL